MYSGKIWNYVFVWPQLSIIDGSDLLILGKCWSAPLNCYVHFGRRKFYFTTTQLVSSAWPCVDLVLFFANVYALLIYLLLVICICIVFLIYLTLLTICLPAWCLVPCPQHYNVYHCWQRQLCLWDELLLIVCFACCFVFTLLLFHFWSLLCAGAGCHFQIGFVALWSWVLIWSDHEFCDLLLLLLWFTVRVAMMFLSRQSWSVPTRACLSFCHIHCLYDASQCQRKSVRVDHYAP